MQSKGGSWYFVFDELFTKTEIKNIEKAKHFTKIKKLMVSLDEARLSIQNIKNVKNN